MTKLSKLEKAVALLLARQMSPGEDQTLVKQIETAEVLSREFTPSGFYTDFQVNRTLPPAVVATSPGGWVRSNVGPNAYPLEFMLYVQDGYAETIEAYSYDDGYGDLDLLTAPFTEPVGYDSELE